MKKYIFALLVLIITSNVQSQTEFLGFDQPFCPSPMDTTYSFVNYSGQSLEIFRNGVVVFGLYYYWNQFAYSCSDLIFINDSTGFMVYKAFPWVGSPYLRVAKTSDYGNTWTTILSENCLTTYQGLYIVNKNYAYLVGYSGCYNREQVIRCSDIPSMTIGLIYDPLITSDIYKTDTVFGNSLCNIDSLKIFVKNNLGDTIVYHINISQEPLPISVNELNTSQDITTIYPNPAKSNINIEHKMYRKTEIYNLNGEKILESHSSSINIEGIANGLYLLKIFDSKNNVFYTKLIKN